MHIVLVGPGALGSLLTVRLHPVVQKEGCTLTLLDHDYGRVRLLSRTGLSLEENGKSFTVRPRITLEPREIASCDVLLLCVKANDVEKALQRTKSFVADDTLVVGLQNGMGHLDFLQQAAGRAVAATSSEGAYLKAPGKVIHGGTGLTRFGLLDKKSSVPVCLQKLVQLFIQAGFSAQCVEHIHPYLWEKLFVNVGINALSAIHNRKNGQLLESDSILKTMQEAVAEAVAVARANDIPVSGDPLAYTLSVCKKTAENISSMLQDVRKRRRTEIDSINGYIVSEGISADVATPVNVDLVRCIKEIEDGWQVGHETTE